jgi:hypothetical protein
MTYPAGATSLEFPGDLIELKWVYAVNSDGTLRPLAKGSPSGFTRDYTVHGNAFRLSCIPSEDVPLVVEYQAAMDPPTDEVGQNWVQSWFPDVYIYGALKEAAIYLRKDSPLWLQEYQNRVADLQAQGWNQNIGVAHGKATG